MAVNSFAKAVNVQGVNLAIIRHGQLPADNERPVIVFRRNGVDDLAKVAHCYVKMKNEVRNGMAVTVITSFLILAKQAILDF